MILITPENAPVPYSAELGPLIISMRSILATLINRTAPLAAPVRGALSICPSSNNKDSFDCPPFLRPLKL